MSLNFANNNSLSAITSLPASITGGALTLLETQTASSSATISFTSNIDSTYDAYMFKFYNIHPATDNAEFSFQGDTGTNTNYNQTITSTMFTAYHHEDDSQTSLGYFDSFDQAQGTAFQTLQTNVSNDSDNGVNGTLQIFNPSSSTFVKHFISNTQSFQPDGGTRLSHNHFTAGYFNTTSAITSMRFQYGTGNIDAGTIKMYGVS